MTIRNGDYVLVALALAAVSTVANAQPVLFDGHFYEVVVVDTPEPITWDEARDAAAAMVHPTTGVQGHLATINTVDEDVFLHDLVAEEPATATSYWVGGFQEANVNCGPPDPAPEPRCGWKWINGELIDPDNSTGLNYTNWALGEPNNTSPGENHLAIGRFPQIGWNDEGTAPNLIAGYIVEYGDALVPFAASTCAAGGPGCSLGTGGSVMTYPQGAIVQGEVEVRTWRIVDDPARCGIEPLILNLVAADGPLVIAPYLCSTFGEIVVRRTEAPQVVFNRGVIQIIGTGKYGTADPIFPADPTNIDVVVYRNNLASSQLEKADEMGVLPLFLGNVAEVTNGVINPPRGSGGKGSYFVEGLRIHFPPGFGYGAPDNNPDGNHTQMVALQRYKLAKGLDAIQQAKRSLKTIDWLALKTLGVAALFFHDRGNYDAARVKVKLLLKLNDAVTYKVIAGTNDHADVAYRYLNADYMYRAKIIPYAP